LLKFRSFTFYLQEFSRKYSWIFFFQTVGTPASTSKILDASNNKKWQHEFNTVQCARHRPMNSNNIFAASTQGGSQFWRCLNKIKHFFKLGSRFVVGNDRKTFFWTDCWLGESPLAVRFPRLFDICASKEILVAEALSVSAT
jgi:hypothetical protein